MTLSVFQLCSFIHGLNQLPLRAASLFNSQKHWDKKVKGISCVIKSNSLLSQTITYITLLWNTSNTNLQAAWFLSSFYYLKSYSTYSYNTSFSVWSTCDILYPRSTVLLVLLNLNNFSLSCIFIPLLYFYTSPILLWERNHICFLVHWIPSLLNP